MELWRRLKRKLLARPEQTVCEGEANMTYAALAGCAEALAVRLTPFRCCAILCGSERLAAVSLLGCFAAGVTAVPLSARYGETHCRRVLGALRPDAVITDEGGELRVQPFPDAGYRIPERHPAVILYTSGTTGVPKGVMLGVDGLLANVTDIAAYLAVGERDTILIVRPLYHGAVLTGEFLTALWKGLRVCFDSGVFHPSLLPGLLRESGAAVVCGTPTLLSLAARFLRGPQQKLRAVCVSGECMDARTGLRLAEAFPAADIYHVYGLTEAGPRVSYLPPALFRDHPDSVGIPLRTAAVQIRRRDGRPAAPGEIGSLYVRGRSIMLGYYGAPEATDAVLQNGWLYTGDAALLDENGLLYIKGREDDMINKAGMNIYPQELESALLADPRVREVTAYGFRSPSGVQIGLKLAGDFGSVREVRALCRDVLPAYAMPAKIECLLELDKNGSGKLKRGEEHAGI